MAHTNPIIVNLLNDLDISEFLILIYEKLILASNYRLSPTQSPSGLSPKVGARVPQPPVGARPCAIGIHSSASYCSL
jgi:hypothetical protein